CFVAASDWTLAAAGAAAAPVAVAPRMPVRGASAVVPGFPSRAATLFSSASIRSNRARSRSVSGACALAGVCACMKVQNQTTTAASRNIADAERRETLGEYSDMVFVGPMAGSPLDFAPKWPEITCADTVHPARGSISTHSLEARQR